MTDTHDDTGVAAFNPKASPPICEECELPMEEVTHGYIYEWVCVSTLCVKCFRATFEELTDPELLIILGRPDCYRCNERRAMIRVGNVVRFECANPACNELVRLISAKNARANKERAAVTNAKPSLAVGHSAPQVRVGEIPASAAPPKSIAGPTYLRAVPPLDDSPAR